MDIIPFGYRIIDGKAVICDKEAKAVQDFFQYYLEGNSIQKASFLAGMSVARTTGGNILKNKVYLGTDYYPGIIDVSLFQAVQEERQKRYSKMGEFSHSVSADAVPVNTRFRFSKDTWVLRLLDAHNPAEVACAAYDAVVPDPEGTSRLSLYHIQQLSEEYTQSKRRQ